MSSNTATLLHNRLLYVNVAAGYKTWLGERLNETEKATLATLI